MKSQEGKCILYIEILRKIVYWESRYREKAQEENIEKEAGKRSYRALFIMGGIFVLLWVKENDYRVLNTSMIISYFKEVTLEYREYIRDGVKEWRGESS